MIEIQQAIQATGQGLARPFRKQKQNESITSYERRRKWAIFSNRNKTAAEGTEPNCSE
jgi:hypothetical protein